MGVISETFIQPVRVRSTVCKATASTDSLNILEVTEKAALLLEQESERAEALSVDALTYLIHHSFLGSYRKD